MKDQNICVKCYKVTIYNGSRLFGYTIYFISAQEKLREKNYDIRINKTGVEQKKMWYNKKNGCIVIFERKNFIFSDYTTIF